MTTKRSGRPHGFKPVLDGLDARVVPSGVQAGEVAAFVGPMTVEQYAEFQAAQEPAGAPPAAFGPETALAPKGGTATIDVGRLPDPAGDPGYSVSIAIQTANGTVVTNTFTATGSITPAQLQAQINNWLVRNGFKTTILGTGILVEYQGRPGFESYQPVTGVGVSSTGLKPGELPGLSTEAGVTVGTLKDGKWGFKLAPRAGSASLPLANDAVLAVSVGLGGSPAVQVDIPLAAGSTITDALAAVADALQGLGVADAQVVGDEVEFAGDGSSEVLSFGVEWLSPTPGDGVAEDSWQYTVSSPVWYVDEGSIG